MVKAAVYMLAFYLVYITLLCRDTSYTRNRFYIIFSIASALLLPIITLHTEKPLNIQFFGKLLSEVFVTARPGTARTFHDVISLHALLRLFYSSYIIVVIAFLVKLLTDVVNLLFLIIRNRNKGSRIIKYHDFSTSGFSAMGYIFINERLDHEDSEEIIRHEQKHVNQNHFVDIIFIELVKAFQWFNPVVYLFDRSLRAIHEFQADQECLNSGVTIINYQSLLLNQVFKSRVFNLTNSFSNPSLIKKRMVMMTKKRSSPLANAKMILVLPVVGIVFLTISAYSGNSDTPGKQSVTGLNAFSSSKETAGETMPPPPPPPPPPQESNNSDHTVKGELINKPIHEPYTVVEEMPEFPGGDAALLRYIAENTNYPETAKEQNIQGKVIIRFCITPDGGVSLVSVLKGVSPDLDAEALRVVNSLPLFKPGRQGGKQVPVWYMVPISFALK
jgi:bla regulator protein blaR1